MWIVFAILARVFWAMGNAVDQMLARAHPRQGAYAAVILELLAYLPFAVAIYFIFGPFPARADYIIYSAGTVLGAVLGLIPYYMALRHEHAHDVTPYLELTPVFLIVLAYLFKGEVLTPLQLTGALMVVVSGFLFSWDFRRGRFKVAIFVLLAAASLLFAFYQYCASQAQVAADLWAAAAAYYFGSSLVGFIVFAAWRGVRITIVKTARETKGRTVWLVLSTRTLALLAFITLLQAFRLAPTLGHVAGFSGAQPIFSFALAFPLARFFPRHFTKVTFDREVRLKMLLILSIAAGAYLLATP